VHKDLHNDRLQLIEQWLVYELDQNCMSSDSLPFISLALFNISIASLSSTVTHIMKILALNRMVYGYSLDLYSAGAGYESWPDYSLA
jgi:hypothetical protein